MKVDAASVALSGLRASGERLRASAHNVANLLTEDFRPERVVQSAEAEGGVSTTVERAAPSRALVERAAPSRALVERAAPSRALVERAAAPAEVDLASELVDQQLAALQGKASLRVLDVHLDMLGSVLDLHG
jgi:flagellar basal body rod protein FlgC